MRTRISKKNINVVSFTDFTQDDAFRYYANSGQFSASTVAAIERNQINDYATKAGISKGVTTPNKEYKLHISLSKESYTRYKEAITEFLINELKKDSLKYFKNSNTEILQHTLDVNIQIKNNFESKYAEEGLGDDAYDAVPKSKQERLIAYEKAIKSHRRFLDGTQFTLYIPTGNDSPLFAKKMADFIIRLDIFLEQLSPAVIAGTKTDVESQLTNLITFRQSRTSSDRIDPLGSDNTANQQIKAIHENTLLFKTIKSELVAHRNCAALKNTIAAKSWTVGPQLFSKKINRLDGSTVKIPGHVNTMVSAELAAAKGKKTWLKAWTETVSAGKSAIKNRPENRSDDTQAFYNEFVRKYCP